MAAPSVIPRVRRLYLWACGLVAYRSRIDNLLSMRRTSNNGTSYNCSAGATFSGRGPGKSVGSYFSTFTPAAELISRAYGKCKMQNRECKIQNGGQWCEDFNFAFCILGFAFCILNTTALLASHLASLVFCNSLIHGCLQGVTDDHRPDPFVGATTGRFPRRV